MLLALVSASFGQGKEFTKWTATLEPADARAGESARILIKVAIDKPWHMYGTVEYKPTDPSGSAPINATIALAKNNVLDSDGAIVSPAPIKKYDDNFKMEVEYYEDQAIFALPVKIKAGVSGKQEVSIDYGYQVCKKGTCDIPRGSVLKVSFDVAPGEARSDHQTALTSVPDQPAQPGVGAPATGDAPASSQDDPNKKDLFSYLLFCFGAGLASLLLPCVFPMIPITVSFFSKQKPGEERKTNYKGAVAYCLGIISTFTLLGLLVTIFFGAAGIQNLATNAWVNGAMFLVFVGLGLSLFGVFNIALPSGIVNKVSAKSRMGGVIGPILMGLTFSLTSFTCTVPVVGALLVAAAKGDIVRPTLGMLAFSTAFSLPFFLLALFPSVLSKLPRSGSWMNTVKAFMGFLELAFAVKFLSNIDVVYQWGLLTRPMALGIWFALAVIAGAFLLGWLKLGGDHGGDKIGWLRRGFGVATLAAGVLCLAAMDGFKLGKIGALLPPDPYPGRANTAANALPWIRNYNEALAIAKTTKKPVFINFTGYSCTNCRYMEENIFPLTEVRSELKDMIVAELYTDAKTDDNRKNQQLQQQLTGTVTLPIYVVVTPEGKVLDQFGGSTEDPDQFAKFIRGARSKMTAVAIR